MNGAEKIAVIVPAFNEEDCIRDVILQILSVAWAADLRLDVIVVNDCSTDHTSGIIAKEDCIALNLPVNLGIGGAMQTGFRFAYENNYDYAIQVDGDGQHPAEEIPSLVKALKEKNWDVAIGSRFISNKGYQSTFLRRIGISYFKFLNRFFCGLSISDSTSGMRALNRKALKIVCDYYPDEYPEPEAILLYSVNNLKLGEIPVTMKERQGGVSSIRSFGSVYYMFKVSLAIFFTFIRLKVSHPES